MTLDVQVDAVHAWCMSTTLARPVHLADLIDGIRAAVAVRDDWADTAQLVAEELRAHLPGPDVLTTEQRLGLPDDHCSHTLHVESDGSFSIVALVWRTGQSSRIHDHVTWCVLGVIQGVEREEIYDADLNLVGSRDNQVGEIGGLAPPGDIHRVRNMSETTAISIHIYGTDINRIGSVRRYYD